MEDAMRQKLNQIKEIMEKTKDIGKGKKSAPLASGHCVSIVSALEEGDVQWLQRFLSSAHFQEQVKSLNFINIAKVKEKHWEKLMAETTFCFYASSDCDWAQGAAHRVKPLSAQGKKNLVVVIDDVKTDSDEEKKRILAKCPEIKKYAKGLFLFGRTEKELDYQRIFHRSLQPGPEAVAAAAAGAAAAAAAASAYIATTTAADSTATTAATATPAAAIATPTAAIATPAAPTAARGLTAAVIPKVVIGIRYKVGIFSRSGERDFSWLTTLLTSEAFRDHVLSVRPCFIANNGYQQFNEDLAHCTFGILYHTKNSGRLNITDLLDSIYDEEIQHLSMSLEKKNIVVVIDDVEDTSDQEKSRILHAQPKIAAYARDLILISHQDKIDNMGLPAKSKILRHFLGLSDDRLGFPPANSGHENQRGSFSNPSIERSRPPSYKAPPELPASSIRHAPPAASRSVTGIFSRSEEGDYSWLKRLLTSEEFGHKDVLCCKVSGPGNEALRDAAFRSKFGILYHSMKNGKIRLTDVKDSLYDAELEQLSTKLGKRKMIVVIDDLNDYSEKMKQKLLEKQPSLGRLVAEIFLFTAAEKKDLENQTQGKQKSKVSKSTKSKIEEIKKFLT